MVKQVLGRGLGALLSGNPQTVAAPHVPVSDSAAVFTRERVERVPLARIQPSALQPRKDFSDESLKELADSIRANGIIQPLIVRNRGPHYELIAGERRWRASQIAGLPDVPVIVRQADDRTVLELALIENLQRENLNPIEEAAGYAQLISQFGLTQEQAAAKVGRSRAAVANAIRLLKLPATVQTAVREGRLSTGHAKVILGLPTEALQTQAAERALDHGLNVRDLEKLVAVLQLMPGTTLAPAEAKPAAAPKADVHVMDLENKLRERLGTKIALRYKAGKGRLEIQFFNDDELERILQILGVSAD